VFFFFFFFFQMLVKWKLSDTDILVFSTAEKIDIKSNKTTMLENEHALINSGNSFDWV